MAKFSGVSFFEHPSSSPVIFCRFSGKVAQKWVQGGSGGLRSTFCDFLPDFPKSAPDKRFFSKFIEKKAKKGVQKGVQRGVREGHFMGFFGIFLGRFSKKVLSSLMWNVPTISRISYFLESVRGNRGRMYMTFFTFLAGDLGQKKTEKTRKMRDVDSPCSLF